MVQNNHWVQICQLMNTKWKQRDKVTTTYLSLAQTVFPCSATEILLSHEQDCGTCTWFYLISHNSKTDNWVATNKEKLIWLIFKLGVGINSNESSLGLLWIYYTVQYLEYEIQDLLQRFLLKLCWRCIFDILFSPNYSNKFLSCF